MASIAIDARDVNTARALACPYLEHHAACLIVDTAAPFEPSSLCLVRHDGGLALRRLFAS